MKYKIVQSFARYEKGVLVECRFMVKNKQGEVLYHCNSLISAQKRSRKIAKREKVQK